MTKSYKVNHGIGNGVRQPEEGNNSMMSMSGAVSMDTAMANNSSMAKKFGKVVRTETRHHLSHYQSVDFMFAPLSYSNLAMTQSIKEVLAFVIFLLLPRVAR